jgi:hypothetical protein
MEDSIGRPTIGGSERWEQGDLVEFARCGALVTGLGSRQLEKSLAAPASQEELPMTTVKEKRLYHRLVVVADPKTIIWLVDDIWHPVQKAIGRLDTSVERGRYFIELGATGLKGIAYPIELFDDLRLTQNELEAGPACRRQPPKLLDE